jgi:PadR family transcriptional regulator, regulatory protein PadR
LIADQKTGIWPKNWLTPVALVILREETSYGYGLMERIEEFGFEAINPGTLYRKLRQMEREGLCKSEWETSGSGPARRMYSVTVEGIAYLNDWAKACKKYQKVLDSFTQTYKRDEVASFWLSTKPPVIDGTTMSVGHYKQVAEEEPSWLFRRGENYPHQSG